MAARVLHATPDLEDGLVDQLDCAGPMAALIGRRRLQLALRRQKVIERGPHVWLTGCATHKERNDEDPGKQERQRRVAPENSVKILHMPALVTPLVLDAPLDLPDGIVDQADGFGAMPALVGFRHFKLLPGGTKVLECGLHVRLVGKGTSCQEPAEAGDGQNERSGGETSGGTRENCCDQGGSSFLWIRK
jgi:hypothetical protein